MEEKVLIKGNIAQSVKSIFKWIIITFIALSILCLVIGILGSIIGKGQWESAKLENAWDNYSGKYYCTYHGSYYYMFSYDSAEEYLQHLETHDYSSYAPFNGYNINSEIFFFNTIFANYLFHSWICI